MRTSLLFLLAIAAATTLAACGGSDSSDEQPKLDPTAGPATIVPDDAPLYFEALVAPGDDQTQAIKDVVSKVSAGKVTDPGAEIIKAIEESAGDSPKIDFDDDIEPWLGNSAAVFASDLSNGAHFAVIIESTDEGEAKDFVQKAKESGDEETTYNGVDLLIDDDTGVAVTDDYLLIGDVEAVKDALDVEGDENLATDATFEKTANTVSGSLAFGYVSMEGIKDAIESSANGRAAPTSPLGLTGGPEFNDSGINGGAGSTDIAPNVTNQVDPDVLLDILGDSDVEAVGFGANLNSDSVAIEAGAIGGKPPTGEPSTLLPDLPADALVALGAGNIGENATQSLDQIDKLDPSGQFRSTLSDFERDTDIDLEEDLFSWMGDGALFVRGTGASDIGGALIVKTSDPEATEDAIDELRQVTDLGGTRVDTDPITSVDVDEGFEIDTPSGPPIEIALKGDKFVIAVGNDALEDALEPADTLGNTDTYKDATSQLPNGSDPSLFLDIPQIVDLAGNLSGNDPGFREVKTYVDAFGALVAGVRTVNGSPVTQVAVGIR